MGFKNISLGLGLLAMLGLAACGGGAVVSDGVCSLEEKGDAKILLEGLDTMPLGEDAVKAIEEGCKVSKTDKEQFVMGLLGDLKVDPACSSDNDLQILIDNWEGADLSDIARTCSEDGPGPDESPVAPGTKVIAVEHDVFSIVGRGHFLTLNFSEPIKADTADFRLSVLLEVTKDADGNLIANFANLATNEAQWTEDRKGLIVPISQHHDPKTNTHTTVGDYRATIKADGDAADHKADVTIDFTIEPKASGPDADNDGVADDKDLCPGTPAGTAVGDAGCPPLPPAALDSDGDGVEESQDKCPGTMKDWPVDGTGCGIIYTFTPNYGGYLFPVLFHQPKIVESTPADGAKDVGVNTSLSVTFDTPIKTSSLKSHFKLKVFAVLFWADVEVELQTAENTGKKYVFKSVEPLKPGALYTIVIEKGVETEKGVSTEDIVVAFGTKK